MSLSVFIWSLAAAVLLLHSSSFDIFTYIVAIELGLIAGGVVRFFPKNLPTPGKIDSIIGDKMLTLVRRVDMVYDKKGAQYYLKIAATAEPLALLILLLGDFVFTLSYLGLPSTDKFALAVALVALTIATGSFMLEYVQTNVADKLDRITEEHVLFKVVNSTYTEEVYPIVRAVVRERLKYRGSKLEDVYNLDHSLFEPHVLLENLLD